MVNFVIWLTFSFKVIILCMILFCSCQCMLFHNSMILTPTYVGCKLYMLSEFNELLSM